MFGWKNLVLTVFAMVFAGAMLSSCAFAAPSFEINGTVFNSAGVALNNTSVSIIVYDQTWSQIGQTITNTNSSGWFSGITGGDPSYMFLMSIFHTNETTGAVDYVGQSLPAFPYREFSRLSNINFYLKPAATFNITAVNSTGHAIPFAYQIKDTKLGYPISAAQTGSNNVTVYVPADRNYSIMIYPGQGDMTNHFMPVSFEWSNFSSTDSYNITDNAGIINTTRYNGTIKTLHKKFNVTQSFAFVSGYINTSTMAGAWTHMNMTVFLMEAGNMIHSTYGVLPYNMSAWRPTQGGPPGFYTDFYNKSTGFYNISLPYAPAETVKYMLYMAGTNSSDYYGSYRNLTLTGDKNGLNFTMYGLLGTEQKITLNDPTSPTTTNITTKKQTFNLLNASNISVSNVNAHMEIKLDYSNYGAIEFTTMVDTSGQNDGNFSLPLLNVTGIKEMNIYQAGQPPKRTTKTAAEIVANNNITMPAFRGGGIDGQMSQTAVSVAFYKSNSTCDVPAPPADCLLMSSNMGQMNPFSIVVGGGDISMRMTVGGISVHYAGVDLLASGPPDAAFDNSTAETTRAGGFASALRFGSQGPKVYSFVLVSLPYSETAGSGLDDANPVNISIPAMYDENWNVLWNTSLNGTNATTLAVGVPHYDARKAEWETLMGNNTCGSTAPNASNPCYINTTSNRIWLRLPHFSGTQPLASGSLVAAAPPSSGGGGGGGGGAAAGVAASKTVILDTKLATAESYESTLSKGDKVMYGYRGENHSIKVALMTNVSVTLTIASTPYNITLAIGETKNVDFDGDGTEDLSIKLDGVSGTTANITFGKVATAAQKPAEKPAEKPAAEKPTQETGTQPASSTGVSPALIAAVLLVIGGAAYVVMKKKKAPRQVVQPKPVKKAR